MFFVILILIPFLTVLWLGWLWWRLRRVGGRASQWMRWLCLGTSAVVMITYTWVIAQRMGGLETPPHPWLQALLLLWALVFLPFLALPMMGGVALLDAGRAITRRIAGADTNSPDYPSDTPGMSRRDMMRTTALALPVLGTSAPPPSVSRRKPVSASIRSISGSPACPPHSTASPSPTSATPMSASSPAAASSTTWRTP
jgi:hypothetical protein